MTMSNDRTSDTAATAPDRGDGQELEQLRKRAAEYLELAQRTRAEFENYQKRVSRDRDQERKYSFGPVALDLLPILDNLSRALDAARTVGEQGPLVQGVAMVQNQFLEILKRHGVVPIDAQGQPFDPHLHQALMQQPSGDVPPNTVLQVIEQGFTNQDRVLRPAKVVVSTKP
jgi:molecular chaperone GrpE